MSIYAFVTDSVIRRTGQLPRSARRLDTNQWVLGLSKADTATQEACGWYEVTEVSKPADTDTTTHDRSIELVDGTPTVVWTERDKTEDELNPPPSDEDRIADLEAILEALLEG